MEVTVRKAVDDDKYTFIDFAVKLSKFNRSNHKRECKYDDYQLVLSSLQRKAEETFNNRNEDTLILIAELENKHVGYALGRIYKEDETADNGTGTMGLFDELYIDDKARGLGLGQKLIDEIMEWMKNKGVNRVKLHAYSWNDNATKLYGRNGFMQYAASYEKFL